MIRCLRVLCLITMLALVASCSVSVTTSRTDDASSSRASAADPLPEAAIDPSDVEAHLRFLAADELMGRKAGTPGNDVAARYIAEQFRRAGAQPVPGHSSFFQSIPFVHTRPPAAATLMLEADTLRQGEDLLMLAGSAASLEAEAVYVGYGASADAYADADVRGKVVVTHVGTPGATGVQAAFRALPAKQRLAAERGAVALVEVYAGALPWSRLVAFLNRPRFGLDHEAPALPAFWIDGVGREGAWSQAGRTVRLETDGMQQTAATSRNVAAWIEGHDAAVSDEHVILMAHYDHVGAGMEQGPGATPADSIFNGARDNAIGTAALIEAARVLAAAPPRRSMLLLAVTAEEDGLLGSRYYVEHPLRPLDEAVFVLNIDGAGYSDTTAVTTAGWGRTEADPLIRQAAAAFGLEAVGDPVPEQNLFERSDNVNFARRGIPAPTLSTGFRAFTDDGVANYYHRPQDEVTDDFAFAYVTRFMQVYARTARLVANAEPVPFWVPGDPYEETGRALYGASE